MRRPAPSTVRWLILVALLVLWELVPRTQIIPELFLPSLSKTVAVLIRDWHEYGSELMASASSPARLSAASRCCATCCCRCSPACMRCRS
jgi:ABC-type nitrate/sulfonate/bicarbonate transport system permease component